MVDIINKQRIDVKKKTIIKNIKFFIIHRTKLNQSVMDILDF